MQAHLQIKVCSPASPDLNSSPPIIIGVAVYNILLLSGILTSVKDAGITERPPSFIAAGILSAGFDLAVLATLLLILCIGISEGKSSEK